GWGSGGDAQASTAATYLTTPTPNPSPQGGGERAERTVSLCISPNGTCSGRWSAGAVVFEHRPRAAADLALCAGLFGGPQHLLAADHGGAARGAVPPRGLERLNRHPGAGRLRQDDRCAARRLGRRHPRGDAV